LVELRHTSIREAKGRAISEPKAKVCPGTQIKMKHCVNFRRVLFLVIFFSGCKEAKNELTICFTGDLLLDRGVREQINKKGVPFLFKNVVPVFSQSDYVVANLECPVTTKKQPVHKKYIFRAEPEWLGYLKNAGITHLAMANNHTYDQGRSGITDTRDNIIRNKMIPVGYGLNQEESCEPVILQKGKIKVALFSSVLLPLENWTYLPASPGICQASAAELAEKIKLFKSRNKETKVVVILHWGVEFQESPTIEQRQQAMELIDSGADAIIGHHPHVIQGKFLFKNKPVFFSLGNFVFDQSSLPATKGLMVQLIFSENNFHFKEIPVTIRNCKPEL